MMDDDRYNWRRLRSKAGPEYRIFRVRLDTMISPRTGAEGEYVVLECPDWVNVIAMTEDEQVVLVRQYRYGTDSVSLEIPAGNVERGEEPLAAARRELAEETGYTGGSWRLLGRVRPNAAFQDNWCYSFLAEGVRLTDEPHLDEGESIAVELHPRAAVPGLIASGTLDQALMLCAFYWLGRGG